MRFGNFAVERIRVRYNINSIKYQDVVSCFI